MVPRLLASRSKPDGYLQFDHRPTVNAKTEQHTSNHLASNGNIITHPSSGPPCLKVVKHNLQKSPWGSDSVP